MLIFLRENLSDASSFSLRSAGGRIYFDRRDTLDEGRRPNIMDKTISNSSKVAVDVIEAPDDFVQENPVRTSINGPDLRGLDLIADVQAIYHNGRVPQPVIPFTDREKQSADPLLKLRPFIAHFADCLGEWLEQLSPGRFAPQ